MDSVPQVVWWFAAFALAGMLATLWDLSRHEVRHLPKWAWAVIVVAVQFPIGVIAYFVVGRVTEPEEAAVGDPVVDREPSVRRAVRVTAPTPPAGLEGHRESGRAVGRAALAAEPVITTSGVRKTYGSTTALDQIDLVVPRGATYGLIGPNGAGKTTMLAIIAGLRRPTAGTVTLGVDRRALAMLADTPQFEPWLTAWEVVDLARHLAAPWRSGAHVAQALGEVGLHDAATRRVGGFSRGMLQRLGLAACLVGDPEVLVLDEPSSALDPAGRREVQELIGRLARTTTVLLSTHILGDVQQVCDTVGVLDRGHLRFQGPIGELLARTASAYDLHVRGAEKGLATGLADQPWVAEVVAEAPDRLRVFVTDTTKAELGIPRVVAATGTPLVAFNPATDLETAFLELTS